MQQLPTLQTVRFGEFLRDRQLITEEQWLAALAAHWSARLSRRETRDTRAERVVCDGTDRRARIGETIVAHGWLPRACIEREAARFHALDVLEVVCGADDANDR